MVAALVPVGTASCVPASAELVHHAEVADGVGDGVRYVRGQLVRASEQWWFLAVAVDDPKGVTAGSRVTTRDGILMTSFVTNIPSGGRNWLPLGASPVSSPSPSAWDGVTPTGVQIPQWWDYRNLAMGCVGAPA